MKYLHLIFRNLGRRKVRTVFTLLTIFISFILFGLLVLWPSIRRQNKVAVEFLKFMEKADAKSVEKLIEKL